MVKADPSCKLEGECWIGPCTVTQVFEDNGTLQLTRNAPTQGGAVSERWNIRQVNPAEPRLITLPSSKTPACLHRPFPTVLDASSCKPHVMGATCSTLDSLCERRA